MLELHIPGLYQGTKYILEELYREYQDKLDEGLTGYAAAVTAARQLMINDPTITVSSDVLAQVILSIEAINQQYDPAYIEHMHKKYVSNPFASE